MNKPTHETKAAASDDLADPTVGMTQEQLEEKYGTVAVQDKNYMDGIRRGLDKTQSYSGGFWWPRS